LKASVGFGGSCFKKDILNLVYICRSYQLHEVADYWEQVIRINDHQTERFAKQIIKSLYNTVNGKKIAFLGWAFKKDTNDTRESAAIYVADYLLDECAQVVVYDPKVPKEKIYTDLDFLGTRSSEENRKLVEVVDSAYAACADAAAVAILTEWDEFVVLDWKQIYSSMRQPATLFDGRNILNGEQLEKLGFRFQGIGKAAL
jgi:UDPglucose 6-dehydrogenase